MACKVTIDIEILDGLIEHMKHTLPAPPDHACGAPGSCCGGECVDYARDSELLRAAMKARNGEVLVEVPKVPPPDKAKKAAKTSTLVPSMEVLDKALKEDPWPDVAPPTPKKRQDDLTPHNAGERCSHGLLKQGYYCGECADESKAKAVERATPKEKERSQVCIHGVLLCDYCSQCAPEWVQAAKEAGKDATPKHSGNKYRRKIKGVGGGEAEVDVYDVLAAFQVTCPATAHAVKKLLCAGLRGKGDAVQDLKETVDAVSRAVQLAKGREAGAVTMTVEFNENPTKYLGKADIHLVPEKEDPPKDTGCE